MVELAKMQRLYNQLTSEVLGNKMLAWAYLLARGFNDEGEAQAIMDEYPDIEYFAQLYGRAVNDPKVVQAFEDARSAVWEYKSRMDYYERLHREGREEGHREIVEKLRSLGVDEALLEQALTATAG